EFRRVLFRSSHVKKSIIIISLTMIPAILITIFFGKFILIAFGKKYAAEGILLLQIFAVSGIFVSINYIFSAIFKIRHKIHTLLWISIIGTIIIVSLTFYFIHLQLLGIGLAWL